MNQSNLYNYSILFGVWNDLDYDVLLIVKEYLQVHLNRRLLNNDYDKFLELIKEEKKSIFCSHGILKTRQGLKTNKLSGYITSYKGQIHQRRFYIDDFMNNKYYIFGIAIILNDLSGFSDSKRRIFIKIYKQKIRPDSPLDLAYDEYYKIITNSYLTKQKIRMILDDEEKIIQS